MCRILILTGMNKCVLFSHQGLKNVSYSHRAKQMCPIYIHKTGDEPRKQDTQASKGSPLLSEEVPYQITLIGLSQGSLDRRREKVIWEMFSENQNDCNTFLRT